MFLLLQASFLVPAFLEVRSIVWVPRHGNETKESNGVLLLTTSSLENSSRPRHHKAGHKHKHSTSSALGHEVGETDFPVRKTILPDYALQGLRFRACSGIKDVSSYISAGARIADYFGSWSFQPRGIENFIGGCLGAAFLIVCACGEDIIWLLPFISNDCTSHGLVYVACMVVLWLMSYALVLCVGWFEQIDPDIPIKAIVEVASAGLMIPLTLNFFLEWYYEESEVDGVAERAVETSSTRKADTGGDESSSDLLKVVHENSLRRARAMSTDSNQKHKGEFRYGKFMKLFYIALATNLDTIGIFVVLMLREVFHPVELLVGNIAGRMIIIMIARCLNTIPGVGRAMKKIPLWLILAVLTFYACTSAAESVVNGE